jgi:uroporphyrinogen decarboxylase
VTAQPVRRLGVDAAIIFSDILIPVEPMGMALELGDKGPHLPQPIRTPADVERLAIPDPEQSMGFVGEAIRRTRKLLDDAVPVIGFCGAPFTLASYMIEGGGSRNYLFTKKMMYSAPAAWNELMKKLVAVTAEYSAEQVRAGADAIQIFDSWVGCLSVEDYRRYVLPHATDLVKRLQTTGAPIIYFGTDSATLLSSMQETGAEVIGLDWRIPLDAGWQSLGFKGAVQGNLDPVLLFAGWKELRKRGGEILLQAGGRSGHIFNLGHGILPETPVENVKALCDFIRERSADFKTERR